MKWQLFIVCSIFLTTFGDAITSDGFVNKIELTTATAASTTAATFLPSPYLGNINTVKNMREISWNNTMGTDTGSDIFNFIKLIQFKHNLHVYINARQMFYLSKKFIKKWSVCLICHNTSPIDTLQERRARRITCIMKGIRSIQKQ